MDLEQKRLKLSGFLNKIPGARKVYYSPPTGIEMKYPCIIYDLANPQMVHADNIPYFVNLQWTVTIVDEDPDSKIANEFFTIPKCSFDRKFASDDLNHFVFSLYF